MSTEIPDSKRPRAVLVLNQFAVPDKNPGGTRHVEMFSLLKGWQATFVIGNRNYFTDEEISTDDERFKIANLHVRGKSPLRRVAGWIEYSAKALLLGLRAPEVDVVYASSPHLLTPIAGWLLARARRAKLVVEIRDLWPESFAALGVISANGRVYKFLRLLERWIYRRADWIVGVSSQWDSYFELNAPSKKFTAIPNGTDVIAFDAAEPAASVEWAQRCRDTSGLNFVFAGSHGPKDGLDLLLDVVPQFPDDLFILVGDGTDKEKIAARVDREGMGNVMLLSPVPKAELPGYLKLMDVGLHLVSDWDVFKRGMSPNKLHDYLGVGLPVISNAVGEPHAILNEANAGVGVAPRDIAQGITAMKQLRADELKAMGRNGREWMASNRSRPIVAELLETVLDGVTGQK